MRNPPLPVQYEPFLRRALREDLGGFGDLTSNAVLSESVEITGVVRTRDAGIAAGLEMALSTFRIADGRVRSELHVDDGSECERGETLAVVVGPARPILAAERVAMNVLGHLSGIATATRRLVALVAETDARVCCTRKTTPGMRALEKYAVRCGGGTNHRFGLHDAVLIKDNHVALAGGVGEAVARARSAVGHLVAVEVEIDSIAQLEEAVTAGADAVLLDNMEPETVREAVERVEGRVLLEASGGITPETVREVAATGVDLVSVGWLTHSAPALDVGLDLE